MAQSKPPSRYDVFDIGDIPAPPAWHSFIYTAFAINENNSVAGFVEMRITGSGDHTHAVFWTPVAEHGFSAFTLYDLTELAALPDEFCLDGTCDGFGYDINDADVVVGSQETDERQRGYIWNLPTNDDAGGLQTFTIGTLLADPAFDFSVIHGISDASPAVFVGEAEDEGPGGFCSSRSVAFRATFTTTPGSLVRLDSASEQSAAYDINEAATVRAVGQRREACAPALGCNDPDDAQRWVVGGSTELLAEGSFMDTIGRATNNVTQACGDSGEITEPNLCPLTALFWSADAALTAIGSPAVTPQLGALDRTQAWGISPASESLVNVVGTNLFTDRALLWHRNATSAWAAYDLNARITPNCPLEVLSIAHDVNSNGWVVGRGIDCLGRVRGFVLRPAVCPADFDNDCEVDAADLAILIGAWSGTPGINDPGTMLDLDQDGSITASDLAILIGAWGGCGTNCATCETPSPCPAPEGALAFSAAAESDSAVAIMGELFSTAIASIGFGSVEAFNAWSVTAPPEQSASAVQAIAGFLLAATGQGGRGLMNLIMFPALASAASICVVAHADFAYLSNYTTWQQLAPPHTTIDFTDLSPGDWLTDQHVNLGVSFDGGLVEYGADGYLQDGYGVYGGCFMDIMLSTPALAVGTHNPGTMRFKLYQGDQLIYTSPATGSGLNNFRGVISSVPFDRVFLMGVTLGPPSCDAIFIDNFYFASVPGPGGAAVLVGSMLLRPRRRR